MFILPEVDASIRFGIGSENRHHPLLPSIETRKWEQTKIEGKKKQQLEMETKSVQDNLEQLLHHILVHEWYGLD